jgi:hypothetical protein
MPEEIRIVDRYAKALAAGKYRQMRDAVALCRGELERLYAAIRKREPNHVVAATGRTVGAMRLRLRARIDSQGLLWAGMDFAAVEMRVVERYVRYLGQGRYPDALRAAEACSREMEALRARSARPGRAGGWPVTPRTALQIQRRIWSLGRQSGLGWSRVQWTVEEDRIIKRYSRALVRSARPKSMAATRACRLELFQAYRRKAPGVRESSTRSDVRSLLRLYHRVRYWALKSGQSLRRDPWNRRELAVLNRHVQALFDGKYRYMRDATDGCWRELQRLRLSRRPRTLSAVREHLVPFVTRRRLPRFRALWTQAEDAVIERYARAVESGRYRSWSRAAFASVDGLNRLYARLGQSRTIRVEHRSSSPILGRMLKIVHRLGIKGPVRRLWSEAENRVLRDWLSWYMRRRGTRRLSPMQTAAEGVQEDLAAIGFARTCGACRIRLKQEAMRFILGPQRQRDIGAVGREP